MKKIDIEELFEKGGYKLIHKKYGKERMFKYSSSLMTKESYRRWLRYLHWRWIKERPEYAKRQNHYYHTKRQKEKPYVAVCVKCGKEFNAPRKYYKICPECRKLPTKSLLLQLEIQKKKNEKQQMIKDVQFWYKNGKGVKQVELAERFGVTQKTISNWVRKKLK